MNSAAYADTLCSSDYTQPHFVDSVKRVRDFQDKGYTSYEVSEPDAH